MLQDIGSVKCEAPNMPRPSTALPSTSPSASIVLDISAEPQQPPPPPPNQQDSIRLTPVCAVLINFSIS